MFPPPIHNLPENSPGLDHESAAAAAVWRCSSCSVEPASVGWKIIATVGYLLKVGLPEYGVKHDAFDILMCDLSLYGNVLSLRHPHPVKP